MTATEHDYLIIGSGVAGTTVAYTILQEKPTASILMLEAGPIVEMKQRRSWWDFVVSRRRPYEYCEDRFDDNVSEGSTPWTFKESRLMAYGGSTVHWGGWSLRFRPEDFRLKTETSRGSDWPVTYDDLRPYYRRAEKYLSVSGDTKDGKYRLRAFEHTAADRLMIRAFEQLEMSYGSMPVARARKCMTTGTCKYCPVGARFSASYVLDYLVNSPRFPNFEISCESPVSRLLIDTKKRVFGAEYVKFPEGATHSGAAEVIIVATGAYEAPKLLQRSTHVTWPQGIGNDYDLVGRYLISHPMLFVRGRLPENRYAWQQELDFPTLMSRHYDTPKEQAKGKLFMFKSRRRPRVDLAGMMLKGMTRSEIDRKVRGPMEFELQGFMEEFSNFHNRVVNGPGINQFGLPQTRIGFSRNPDFLPRKDQRLELMREVIERMGCKVIRKEIRPQRGDHAASTCRMSKAPDTGVVDENLRVHGVENLYVCSNAVFPSGAAVNPTLTLTALSLRLGDHLAGVSEAGP